VTPSFSHADWFRARLIVLSDRRPAPGVARTELEAAIEAALREHDGVWLGRHAPEAEAGAEADADVDAGELEGWSVLDEAAVRPGAAMEGWARYARANTAYAERIVESVSSDGVVWINGSRWLLVAPLLRQLGHRGPIGLVLDVPFPAPVRLEALPWHVDVMAALCQLDLIGLRAPTCAEHFDACRAHTGQRQRPRVEVFPDGIASPSHAAPSGWVARFLQLLTGASRRTPRALTA
jgi:trehalose 6-phosphate synthase